MRAMLLALRQKTGGIGPGTPPLAISVYKLSNHSAARLKLKNWSPSGVRYTGVMRSGNIPFQFDMRDLLARARRQFNKRVGATASISIPYVGSLPIHLKDREKQAAREILIRLKDRRVLSSWECCDDCITRSVASLQEIRKLLVDKQVELSDLDDGPLYLLIEMMLAGIRQFVTFEETLKLSDKARARRQVRQELDVRQGYFDGLELLRSHLSHAIGQVAVIAGKKLPKEGLLLEYQGDWPQAAYLPLPKARQLPAPKKRAYSPARQK